MSRYRNIQIEPEGQDVDEDGRTHAAPFEAVYSGMTADDAALAEAMYAANGDGVNRLANAYERNRNPRPCSTRANTRRRQRAGASEEDAVRSDKRHQPEDL